MTIVSSPFVSSCSPVLLPLASTDHSYIGHGVSAVRSSFLGLLNSVFYRYTDRESLPFSCSLSLCNGDGGETSSDGIGFNNSD